jgi:hypothetical protein
MFLTGSSNVATSRRFRPNASKNSFQKVCFSALSLRAPAQELAKRMALWRISFYESGMADIYKFCGQSESRNRVSPQLPNTYLKQRTICILRFVVRWSRYPAKPFAGPVTVLKIWRKM